MEKRKKSTQFQGKGRGIWDRKLEFMLAMVGYSVGLGNLWRFPYLCMKNGGGAFLIPFLIILLTCGLPLYFMEVALGQFIGRGAMHVWEVCPLFKGVGKGMIVVLTVTTLQYNMIIAWTLHYLGSSFISPLPWTTLDKNNMHERNGQTYLSIDLNHNINGNTSKAMHLDNYRNSSSNFPMGGLILNSTTSSEEIHWQENVLHMSEGIHSLGGMPWTLVVCLLAAWILVYLCMVRGIHSVGKVVYVTATMPYILLFVLLIRGVTLPGSANGIVYYLKPDFSKLLEVKVWIEAAVQVFYSLGPAWGTIITLASFNIFHNNCYRDSMILVLVSEGTSLYGGFTIFSILGFMAHNSNVPIEKVVKSGPGLGFIAYPEAIARLPLSNLWAVLFFIMLLTVGLDSEIATAEAVCTAFMDSFPKLRKRRALFTAIVCTLFFLAGLPLCTQGGIYIFQLLDWYMVVVALPLFGLIECVIFGWIYGAEMFSRDVELMIGRKVPVLMRIMWCFITPLVLISILGFTIKSYVPPTYGSYEYPRYAEVVGWMVAVLPVIPLPLQAVQEVSKAHGGTIVEKILTTLRPSGQWLPVETDEANLYASRDRSYSGSVKKRIKLNVLGSI